jgi:hypothetical protein
MNCIFAIRIITATIEGFATGTIRPQYEFAFLAVWAIDLLDFFITRIGIEDCTIIDYFADET